MSETHASPVLKAYVHDIRYFAALLRGVNFANRATITVTRTGLTVTVEEARTLLGTAFIFSGIFDEYTYHSTRAETNPLSQSTQEIEGDNAAFEVPLNTFIDCLNIFGTAGASSAATGAGTKFKKWRKAGEESDQDQNGDDAGGRTTRSGGSGDRGIDHYFGNSSDKKTGMRMTYAGPGYPLTLLMWAAEDASGPTTTCEIATFDSEPHLELPFDSSLIALKIILKSSWLRDALSELDPSCEILSFIGNPPPEPDAANGRPKPRKLAEPMLRIQAAGTFGSTEMDYPNDRDVLETFECKKRAKFSYRVSHISKALRALQTSTKTSLRIDEGGLLSLQFLMPSPKVGRDNSDGFIEFRCLALDEEV